MKSKTILFGATLSVLISSAAFAAGEADLTTRGYVDGGLSFVYQKAAAADAKAAAAQTTATEAQNAATAAQGDVDSLKTVVGAAADGQNAATGLVGKVAGLETVVGATANDGLRATVGTLQNDVTDLKTNVSTLQAASKTYTGGTGITVTAGQGNASSTINLDLPANPTAGANYVFQPNGSGGGTWTALPAITGSWTADDATRITQSQSTPQN